MAASQGVRTTASPFYAQGLRGEILDVCYDHYGLRAAVCSSQAIAIFEKDAALNSDSWSLHACWEAVSNKDESGLHRGYLRKVCWAHAEFGQVVASASTDGSVCIWTEAAKKIDDSATAATESKVSSSSTPKEEEHGWGLSDSFKASRTACLDMCFAPPQYGLRLGLCFQDGYVKMYDADDIFQWSEWQLVQEFQVGASEVCQRFCWRPFSLNMPEMILIGSTRQASVWSFESNLGRWQQVISLGSNGGAGAAVSDVAWASACGKTSELIAYAAGSSVYIVQLKDKLDQLDIKTVAECKHDSVVFQIEWNRLGTTLATSGSDGNVRLWRPDLTDEWHEMANITNSASA